MILGFKPQFVEPILNGTKIHTIREDAHNRWKPGNSIQFATGVRTKQYKKFRDGYCISTQQLRMDFSLVTGLVVYVIDGEKEKKLSKEQLQELAINDGFKSLLEFEQWFMIPIINQKKRYFKLIHWTSFRY